MLLQTALKGTVYNNIVIRRYMRNITINDHIACECHVTGCGLQNANPVHRKTDIPERFVTPHPHSTYRGNLACMPLEI